MVVESPNLESSCPFCDHKNGSCGRVYETGDGSFICKECGSHWRDINSNGAASLSTTSELVEFSPEIAANQSRKARISSGPDKRTGLDKPVIQDMVGPDKRVEPIAIDSRPVAQARFGDETGENDNPGRSKKDRLIGRGNFHSRMDLVMVGAASFVGILALAISSFYFLGLFPPGQQTSHLAIKDVTYQRMGMGRANIVRVSGVLYNPTDEVRQFPRLKLILVSSEGDDVLSWTYSSPNRTLSPDGNIRFSSAMSPGELEFEKVAVKVIE